MRFLSSLVSSSACATAIAFFASSAAAHIELVEPAPRYELPANKSCPCGDGDSNRRCMVTAEESHDPARSSTVTTFEAGSTIHVVADEYIDHAGRMRVAFDDDGADLADFNKPENILADVPDPSESGLSMANPHVWEFDVKLPDEPCDNCTLQVIQAMHGDTENPVMDPAPLSTYYTCADIRIVPKGSLEAGEGGGSAGTGSGGSANAGEAGGPSSGGTGSSAAGTGGSGPSGNAGTATGAAGTGSSVDDADDEEEDSGCAFRANTSSSAAGVALALLGLAAVIRRRKS
ncbi:MAG TPA: SCE4755 family polysaccharide monooxygenase-like protein [Polyangiaceae bacterium]|nr:SCE4755 family polysaccharide monooxygenase-like protein [Polyangiaceae bacterium]